MSAKLCPMRDFENAGAAANRQLTPDECQAVAATLRDLPPQFQLTPAEVEMLEEEVFQRNLRYDEPARAAAAMKARLAYLMREKAKALDTMEDCDESLYADLTADVRNLGQQITATRDRLNEYVRQQPSAN